MGLSAPCMALIVTPRVRKSDNSLKFSPVREESSILSSILGSEREVCEEQSSIPP